MKKLTKAEVAWLKVMAQIKTAVPSYHVPVRW